MTAPLNVDAMAKALAGFDLIPWEHMSTATRSIYRDMAAQVHAQVSDALAVDTLSAIINESLMGYAPGTTNGVTSGTWNARDDEIDTDGIARELRARLLGEEHT